MNNSLIFFRTFRALLSGAVRLHFSQYGEDVFLHKRFRRPTKHYYYIDIGAHHPYHLSNTAYLWTRGWAGVNVDASADVINLFNVSRPNDLNIQAAVVSEKVSAISSSIVFYSSKGIDNCAACDPDVAQDRGLTYSTTVPCLPLKHIVEKANDRFTGIFGLLNVDIEGLDDDVIQDIDGWPQKPEIIMIEIYGKTMQDILNSRTHRVLSSSGYILVQRMGHTAVFELQTS